MSGSTGEAGVGISMGKKYHHDSAKRNDNAKFEKHVMRLLQLDIVNPECACVNIRQGTKVVHRRVYRSAIQRPSDEAAGATHGSSCSTKARPLPARRLSPRLGPRGSSECRRETFAPFIVIFKTIRSLIWHHD